MKKKIMTLMLAVSMVLALTACGGDKINFEKGTTEGDVYTNASIGIKATVPDGLSFADEATVSEFEESAMSSLESTTNVSEEKLEEMASAMIYDAVIISDGGSSIQIAAENMKITMGKKVSAETYLKSLESSSTAAYESMGCTVTFSGVDKVELGGKEFSHIDMTISISGMELGQTCYALAAGDYMYYMVVTDMGDATEQIAAFFDSFEAVE